MEPLTNYERDIISRGGNLEAHRERMRTRNGEKPREFYLERERKWNNKSMINYWKKHPEKYQEHLRKNREKYHAKRRAKATFNAGRTPHSSPSQQPRGLPICEGSHIQPTDNPEPTARGDYQ